VDEVECIIGDIAGVARGKAMPAAKFAKQTNYFLPNSIFLQTITGEWADNPFDAFTEPDMILEPDWSTATAAPWTADVTLQVIHDAKDQQGNPVPFSAAQRAAPHRRPLRGAGLAPGRRARDGILPDRPQHRPEPAGDPADGPHRPPGGGQAGLFLSAVDEYGKVIDDIYDFAEAQGLEIDGILQEGGAGQIELNLAHGDPVRLADDVFFFKRLIREAACATTALPPSWPSRSPANRVGHAHPHLGRGHRRPARTSSPARRGWKPKPSCTSSAACRKHLGAAVALFAPYVNSYRRYVPDFAAPINLEWGRDNRTTGLRIPISGSAARRVENRLPGMDCNPYLGIAATLACGYLGLMNKTRRGRNSPVRPISTARISRRTWAMRWTCWKRTRPCKRSWAPTSSRSTTA
jgi:glutamine synthetase